MVTIEDSYALLAPLSSNGQQPAVLLTDDGRFEASAEALVDGGKMEMLGITIRHDRVYTRFVIDYMGRLAAMSSSDTPMEVNALVLLDLKRNGISVVHEQKLLADAVSGPKRTSVLKWGDGLSLRVKRMDDSEGGAWLQVRVYMSTSAGYVHLLLTDAGQLVSIVSGRTDQDAWQRVQGELSRQAIEVV